MFDFAAIYLMILLVGSGLLCGFLLIGNALPWFEERWVKRGFAVFMMAIILSCFSLLGALQFGGVNELNVSWNSFFNLKVNMQNAIGLLLANALLAVIGNFSSYYLHRESGFKRYFVYYLLFVVGINFTFVASSMILFIMGWEWVGLSSVMLIGFFCEREGPMRQSRYVFSVYRIADFLLLLGVILLLTEQHGILLPAIGEVFSVKSLDPSTKVALWCFAGAAVIKGAQYPFTSYLVRAMEGPTASSAAFYGALSVHMGPLLLLRFGAWMPATPGLDFVLVALGAVTVLTAMLSGRVKSDVKGQLAYASAGHLGFIFMEIGLGWNQLAFLHILGHMALRTMHFLSSPSFLQLKARWTLHHIRTRTFVAAPDTFLSKLYWKALSGFDVLERVRFLVVDPIFSLAQWIDSVEWRVQKYFAWESEASEDAEPGLEVDQKSAVGRMG